MERGQGKRGKKNKNNCTVTCSTHNALYNQKS